MTTLLRWWSLLLLPSLFFTLPSWAAALEVNINEAQMVRLPQKAKSIFISNTHIADYQPMTNTKLMVFGKQAGTATITILNDKEQVIYTKKIRVVHDTQELDNLIEAQFPEASVKTESLGGKLWLKGSVPSPAMAHSIVNVAKGYLSPVVAQQGSNDTDSSQSSDSSANQIQPSTDNDELINQLLITMPTQVNIRVRIAEVSRNVSNTLGIKWGSLMGEGSSAENVIGSFMYNKPSGVSSWTKPNFSALVDALASTGDMSILAEPNLSAISGEEASFLVGGEVPIPLIQGDTARVEYRPFGVNLNFKPVVLGPDRISLKVEPEVSSVSVENQTVFNGNVLPSFTSRRASTTIELASGQSFSLGGLLQSSEISQLQKVPGIGDIPILGALFRSNQYQRRETELIIIATAYLVEPSRSDNFTLPTDTLIPQSDLERLLALPNKKNTAIEGNATFTDNRKPRLLGDNGFYY
ncbi:type II and III secretion system protein family protein [Vibrio pectenicida]|uniref:Type II and III secretion system protein family protein n=1 Tax=Vibrio pectenicida TaxID=62763 RepID=A0A7Y3ZYR7_9VIBR|nr:type II and III secretion system protein family protein [Vibrio pectenicida]NOH71560.1 type II and III secretion system protein family protein [Vibrio pectenicida]